MLKAELIEQNKNLVKQNGELLYLLEFGKIRCEDSKHQMIWEQDSNAKVLHQKIQKQKEVIDKAINNSQYWIDYYTRLNSDERIALRLQENIDILKEVSE